MILVEIDRRQEAVLRELQRLGVAAFAAFAGALSDEMHEEIARSARLVDIEPPGAAERLAIVRSAEYRATVAIAIMRERAGAWYPGMGSSAELLAPHLAAVLTRNDLLLGALERLASEHRIDALVLSDAWSGRSRIMIDWARAHGALSVMLTHAAMLNRPTTVVRGLPTDVVITYGDRGSAYFAEQGISASAIRAVGNPAWDRYLAAAPERAAIRNAFCRDEGIDPARPLVVFAMTIAPRLTALSTPAMVGETLEGFIAACRLVQDAGVAFSAVVKPRRNSNEADWNSSAQAIASLGARYGVRSVVCARERLFDRFAQSADVVVCADSNVAVEALVAGTPALCTWTPGPAILGPAFGFHDGILFAANGDPRMLADLIRRTLSDPAFRSEVLERGARAVRGVAGAQSGPAAPRAAAAIVEFMGERNRPKGAPALAQKGWAVWDELSDATVAARMRARRRVRSVPRFDIADALGAQPQRVLWIEDASASRAELSRRAHLAVEYVDALEAPPGALALPPGIEPFDAIVAVDVLPRLIDPWDFLRRAHASLAAGGRLLATVANWRNLNVLHEFMTRGWDVSDAGAFDVRNLRAFTLSSLQAMFEASGFAPDIQPQRDPRLKELGLPAEGPTDITLGRMILQGLTPAEQVEMLALEFLVVARREEPPHGGSLAGSLA